MSGIHLEVGQAEIVEHLEETLRLAQSGQVTGIVVFTHHEGLPHSFSVGRFNRQALATMAHEMFTRLAGTLFESDTEF